MGCELVHPHQLPAGIISNPPLPSSFCRQGSTAACACCDVMWCGVIQRGFRARVWVCPAGAVTRACPMAIRSPLHAPWRSTLLALWRSTLLAPWRSTLLALGTGLVNRGCAFLVCAPPLGIRRPQAVRILSNSITQGFARSRGALIATQSLALVRGWVASVLPPSSQCSPSSQCPPVPCFPCPPPNSFATLHSSMPVRGWATYIAWFSHAHSPLYRHVISIVLGAIHALTPQTHSHRFACPSGCTASQPKALHT